MSEECSPRPWWIYPVVDIIQQQPLGNFEEKRAYYLQALELMRHAWEHTGRANACSGFIMAEGGA